METLQNWEEVALVLWVGIDDTVEVKRQRAAKPDNISDPSLVQQPNNNPYYETPN